VSSQTSQESLEWTATDARTVDLIRVLAMDAVQKAGSGHPGTAMSLAPAAYMLFQRILKHDPADPQWQGRDRFVLSCGHSSLTLYIQLYLSGYGLTLEDLEALRTWGSRTPGHPEHNLTPGVETTTGPLGQGLANAVGMAMAARRERGLLDPDAPAGQSPFDHHIYVFTSDGDIEEGISHEVSSLAAHQQLGNLVMLYDDNDISIEDDTNIAKSEDVLARYAAYGWHTQRVTWRTPEGYHEDVEALYRALIAARDHTSAPSIIALSTLEHDAQGWHALVAPELPQSGPVRAWLATLTADGMPSDLSGPWRIPFPIPAPAPPALAASATPTTLHFEWTWPSPSKVQAVLERSADGATWQRVSPPLGAAQSSFDTSKTADPMHYRLNLRTAASQQVVVSNVVIV